MKSLLFRRFLCLALALLFAFCCVIHPLEAQAVGVGTLVGVSALSLIASIAAGCGLSATGDVIEQFTPIVDGIASSLQSAWGVADGLIRAVVYKDTLYVEQALVQSVLDQLVSSNAVQSQIISTGTYPSVFSYPFDTSSDVLFPWFCDAAAYLYPDVSFAYCYSLWSNDSFYGYMISNYPCVVFEVGIYQWYFGARDPDNVGTHYSVLLYPSNNQYYINYGSSTNYNRSCDINLGNSISKPTYFTCEVIAFPHELVAAEGYVMGNLAPEIESPTYEEWRRGQFYIVNPSDNPDSGGDDNPDAERNKYLLPLGYAADLYNLLYDRFTQEQVQSGANLGVDLSTLYQTGDQVQIQTDAATDPDTGTDPDPNPGTTTNPDAAPDVTPGNFKVDLTSFFPFCIPFDLYKMLSCLSADPVAPKFTFAIPTGLYGQIYEFEIDLAAWDDVAATLRMFETAIFCVGLYFATSKLIKW